MFEIELPPYALEAAVALTVVLGVLAFLTAKDTPLPGPMELPIVSNGLEVSKHLHRLLYYVLDKSREYGTTWTFKIPFVPRFVVVLDRESTFHILKSHFKNYEKGPMFHENLKDLLGDGIFNSDGHRWYVQRKTASHLFSSRMLETVMLPVFEKHTDTVCEQLAAAAKAGSEVDMQDTFHRFTLDSIGEIGFGAPIGSLEDPENPFAKAFDGAQFIAEKRFFTPLWKLSEPFTAAGASFRRSIDVMDSYSFKLIKQRRESGDYLTGEDVLSRFMRLEADDGSMAVLHDDKYLRDVVMNFIIAGRDTTAQALSWSVYMLAQHPEVEARMLAEVEECFPAGTVPSLAAVKSLKYTRAVVLETLRLWPSVPKDSKQAVEDDVLPDGTKIRAGWVVVYVPFVMGRDEGIWGKDAGEFKPTRFLDTTDPDPYMYPVFNAGERQCLGKNMALLEAVMALACIYRRFHLKLVPGQDIQPLNSLTMPQARGVRVHAVPRTSGGSA